MGVYIKGEGLDYSAMRGPCPRGFHIPTESEWTTLRGIVITTFGLGNMCSYLKMPTAGNRDYLTSNQNLNGAGYYWACTALNDVHSSYAYVLPDYTTLNGLTRVYGCSLRGFKDEPVVPDSSWTEIYLYPDATGGSLRPAGIYHNATLGLISVSSDGDNWVTIADKNVGATTVRNSGNSLTAANCGGYFQWGNNYMFPFSGTVTTSSTQVDASNYGPGNYYSSSTFIITSEDWSSVHNNNLWGAETGTGPLMTMMRNAYIGGYYEYSYDFKNKTISEFGADGWTYDSSKAPSFNSDGIYYTSATSTTSGGIELNYNLTSAKKITLNTSFVITNSTTHLGGWGINSSSGTAFSGIMLVNMLGSHQQQIQINNATVTTTNVSVSTGTYTETIEYDLTNKTYTYSGCYPSSGTLTDEQISGIKNNNGLTVAVGGSSGIKISTIDLVVEY